MPDCTWPSVVPVAVRVEATLPSASAVTVPDFTLPTRTTYFVPAVNPPIVQATC